MDHGQHSNEAGPSQNSQDAVIRALQANLEKTLQFPISLFKAKQAQWDRSERAANKRFERRERQVEKHLAKRSTPKPSLRISRGMDYESGSEDDGRADSPTQNRTPRGVDYESGSEDDGRADSPVYEYDSDTGRRRDGYSRDQIVADDYGEQENHNNGNCVFDPVELPEVSDDVSGFCDNANDGIAFNMAEFKTRLSKFSGNAEIEETNADILKTEFDKHSECVLIDADTSERLPGCPEWIPKKQFENGFVTAIIASDYERFFELYADGMESDGTCSERCLCKLNFGPPKLRYTPLHLAAVVSSHEFLYNAVSDEAEFVKARKERITKLLEHRSERVDMAVAHYEKIIYNLSGRRAIDQMYPIDMAAEHGRVREFDAFFRADILEVLQKDGNLRTRKDKDDFVEPDMCYHVPSTLSRLVHQKNFLKLYQDEQDIVMSNLIEPLNIHKKRYAVSLAACNGDMETLKVFQELQIEKLHVFEQRDYYDDEEEALVVPGKIFRDGGFSFFPVQRSPVAHELAEYGHFDAFNSLEVEQKLVRDFYCCTALVSMLQFSDDQVKSQLKLFEKAEREDLFLFVAQVIVKNRRELLKDALQLALVNPDNFDVKPKCNDIYQDYGLPDYVPLPMETALSRTGDMTLVEIIADIYQKYMDKHRRKMIEEDALRCMKSIQDRACRCSDQVRLAVISMMFPFAPPSSKRFKQVMMIHLSRGENDDVSKYVLENHSVSWKTYKFEKWNAVFEKAGKEVKKWNGSFENRVLNNINLQGNKGFGKDTPFFPIRQTPGELSLRRQENSKEKKSIDRTMDALVKAFRKMPLP